MPDGHDGQRVARIRRAGEADLEPVRVVVHGDDLTGPIDRQALGDVHNPRVGDIGDQRGISWRVADPALEGGEDRLLVGKNVGVIPFSVEQHDDLRAVGIEVAGILVGLDQEDVAAAPARGARRAAREARVEQRTDECRGVAASADEQVNQPAGRGRLAVRAGDAEQGLAGRGRGVGNDLLPRFCRNAELYCRAELRVVRVDRCQRLGHGQAFRPRPGIIRPQDVLRGVPPGKVNARLDERGAVRRRPARIAAADEGAGAVCQQNGRGRAGARRAEHMYPFKRADGSRLARRGEALPYLSREARQGVPARS